MSAQKVDTVCSMRLPMEKNYLSYSSSAAASEGQSYVSADGETWNDLTLLSIGMTPSETPTRV